MFYTSICAIAKDEDKDILEWVNYHLGIGFEHLVIYDNNSKNPLRVILREYMENRLVTVIDLPQTDAQQLTAYYHVLHEWGQNTFWLAFIDIDEFIVPYNNTDIRDFLDDYRDYGGIGAHWKIFSSNGHINRPSGYIIENYDKSMGLNNHIKSIVRCSAALAPSSPHHFNYKDGFYCVNEDFIPINDFHSYPIANKIAINHYYYKSQQDFEAKIDRGFATKMKSAESRAIETFYNHLNSPAFPDNKIKRFTPLLKLLSNLPVNELANKVSESMDNNFVQMYTAISQQIAANDPAGAKAILKRMHRYHNSFNSRLVDIMIKCLEGEDLQAIKMLGKELARPDISSEEKTICLKELAKIYRRLGDEQTAVNVENFSIKCLKTAILQQSLSDRGRAQ